MDVSMNVPLKIAKKLLLLLEGQTLADSASKHPLIDDLVDENIIVRKGRVKKTIQLQNAGALATYLQNHYVINDLASFIQRMEDDGASRADLAKVSSDSKLKNVRTFKGFLVNSFQPLDCSLHNEPYTLNPQEGTFTFIYDFEQFIPPLKTTIVGIENSENFRHIQKQKSLFAPLQPLFVCRYPQNNSKDLIKWLTTIPNNYLHFGDFDLAGINIYVNEFKRHLGNKSSFFVPENIEELLATYGNKDRYNNQKEAFDKQSITEEPALLELLKFIHHFKKGLDQEVLIDGDVV